MQKTYVINIQNGRGSKTITNGTYGVSANIPGYNNDSINPQLLDISSESNEYNLTISADGNLTLHVTEDGTPEGTPVVGAVFYRTDSNGTTYGNPVTTDLMGNATLTNLPYDFNTAPVVFFKQVATPDDYESNNEVMQITLSEQETTIEVTNSRLVAKTFIVTDANYDNLPVNIGSITLS